MARLPGLSGTDRWLRKPVNRAVVTGVLLIPVIFLFTNSSLPDATDSTTFNSKSGQEKPGGLLPPSPPLSSDPAAARQMPGSPPPPGIVTRSWPPLSPPPPPPLPRPRRTFPAGSLPFLLPRCGDGDPQCTPWHLLGECERNPGWMFYFCQRACEVCNVSYVMGAVPDRVEIAPGVSMPTVGFGTAGMGEGTLAAVQSALHIGYRLLDSAQAREWYREDLVGSALAASAVPRSEVFLTSKLHPRDLGYWNTMDRVRQSLADLQTDYLDLFLLHYPDCNPVLCPGFFPEGSWQDSWAALEELVREGALRTIGVANFELAQLEELASVATIRPAVVQTQSEPRDQNRAVRAWCRREGVVHQAYSTLGTQHGAAALLAHPVVRSVADAHAASRATPAQVLLAWALRHGSTVLPRSTSAAHQQENLAARALVLTPAEMQDLDGLEG